MTEIMARDECFIKGEEKNAEKKVKDIKKVPREDPTNCSNNIEAITPHLSESRRLANIVGGPPISSHPSKHVETKSEGEVLHTHNIMPP